MKSTKKLFIATLMLVFAFVAVVSSTFAWFTTRQEAEVNDLKLKAATAGTDLQISTTEDGSYGYAVTLPETLAQLTPVTYDISDNNFYKLAIDTAEGENKNKFKYVAATPIAPGTPEKTGEVVNEGYLAFDLYFKTASTSNVVLNLDTTSIFGAVSGTEILGTLRVMFVEVTTEIPTGDYANAKIYENAYDANSTFGTGAYYLAANNYIAYNAFTHTSFPFLNALSEGKYSLNETTFFNTRKYTTTTPISDKIELASDLSSTTPKHYKVFIWLEGWDGDTNNTASLKEFTTYLKFTN